MRIPAAIGEKVRIELRSPDPTVNPYLAFALIIGAGLDGIEKALPLPPAVNVDLYKANESITNELMSLPDSLDRAIEIAESSEFVKSVIGEEMLFKYIAIKKEEAASYHEAEDKEKFYKDRYFRYV